VKVDENQWIQQSKNLKDEGIAVKAQQNKVNQGEEIGNTTITNMIRDMQKYVIPPHMDFVKYDDIDPFAMYIFEFNHTLAQKELVDIWQGITPDSALKVEKDEIEISHLINQHEFFGNFGNVPTRKPVFGKMKFFIFKVKKKAKQNYYEITKDSTDDDRFKFTFQGDGAEGAVPPQGSYNWMRSNYCR